MVLLAALLVFLSIVVLVVGIWWDSQTDRTVRDIAREHPKFRDKPDLLNQLLDPWHQTEPHEAKR